MGTGQKSLNLSKPACTNSAFLVIHFPDPSLFPFFVSFLPCLCFLMPVQIVYSTVPDSLAERI